jgi:hypothetical protein
MQVSDVRAKASAMMPSLLGSLESLVAIPSVAEELQPVGVRPLNDDRPTRGFPVPPRAAR